MSKQFHPSYRADIDGLRAIAVLSVVGFHAFPSTFPGGFIGVDIFFVISGFLITTIIASSLRQDNFSFLEFYGRRVKRIFPALLLVLWSCLLFGYVVLTPDELTQLGKHVAGGAGFISNILLKKESGYFNTTAEVKPLLHLWSLGIEEQFYIAWPLILWAGRKKPLRLFGVILCMSLGSFLLNIARIERFPVGTFYLPQTRVWELMIGSILAYWVVHLQNMQVTLKKRFSSFLLSQVPRPLKSPDLWSLAGFILIAIALGITTKSSLFPGWWALLPTLGALMILAAGPRAKLNALLLGTPVLRWIGLISFPLYLWHWPLLTFARILEGQMPSSLIRSVAVALSLLFAWLTFQFAERPIRFVLQTKAWALRLSALMLITGLTGYITLREEGFSDRLDNQQLVELFAKYPHAPFHNTACDERFPEFKNFSACLLSLSDEPEVVVIGDSHSNQYFKAFASLLPKQSVLNITEWTCLPFATDDLMLTPDCRKKSAAALDLLIKSKSINQIYLAGYWNYLLSGKFALDEDNWRQPVPANTIQQTNFMRNAETFIEALLMSGKEVILIKDIPDLDFNIRSCFNFRPFSLSNTKRTSCTTDRLAFDARTAPIERLFAELQQKFPSLKIVDPRAALCDSSKCRATQDDLPLYYNGDHLSLLGSEIVVRTILKGRQTSKE